MIHARSWFEMSVVFLSVLLAHSCQCQVVHALKKRLPRDSTKWEGIQQRSSHCYVHAIYELAQHDLKMYSLRENSLSEKEWSNGFISLESDLAVSWLDWRAMFGILHTGRCLCFFELLLSHWHDAFFRTVRRLIFAPCNAHMHICRMCSYRPQLLSVVICLVLNFVLSADKCDLFYS